MAIVVVTAFAAIWEHRKYGIWWVWSHWLVLLSFASLIPLANWLRFVPSAVEWSQDGCNIEARRRGRLSFRWEQLERFETGGLFVLQFAGPARFHVLTGAFERKQWQEFQDFLITNFPEKRYSTWKRPWPGWR
jgi:hypothetical protein